LTLRFGDFVAADRASFAVNHAERREAICEAKAGLFTQSSQDFCRATISDTRLRVSTAKIRISARHEDEIYGDTALSTLAMNCHVRMANSLGLKPN
jgi:hypothetical protein